MILISERTRQINIAENEQEHKRMISFDISGISEMTFKYYDTGNWKTSYGIFENISMGIDGIFVNRVYDNIIKP